MSSSIEKLSLGWREYNKLGTHFYARKTTPKSMSCQRSAVQTEKRADMDTETLAEAQSVDYSASRSLLQRNFNTATSMLWPTNIKIREIFILH